MSAKSAAKTTVVRVGQGSTVEVRVPVEATVKIVQEQPKRKPLSAAERAILEEAIALCKEASGRQARHSKSFLDLLLGR